MKLIQCLEVFASLKNILKLERIVFRFDELTGYEDEIINAAHNFSVNESKTVLIYFLVVDWGNNILKWGATRVDPHLVIMEHQNNKSTKYIEIEDFYIDQNY